MGSTYTLSEMLDVRDERAMVGEMDTSVVPDRAPTVSQRIAGHGHCDDIPVDHANPHLYRVADHSSCNRHVGRALGYVRHVVVAAVGDDDEHRARRTA